MGPGAAGKVKVILIDAGMTRYMHCYASIGLDRPLEICISSKDVQRLFEVSPDIAGPPSCRYR
jgi:hypothetical protein